VVLIADTSRAVTVRKSGGIIFSSVTAVIICRTVDYSVGFTYAEALGRMIIRSLYAPSNAIIYMHLQYFVSLGNNFLSGLG